MMIISHVKTFLFGCAERAHLLWYTRSQRFAVTYRTSIRNTSADPQSFRVVVPIPSSTDNQIVSNEVFNPEGGDRGVEPRFANAYYVWPVTLQPGEEKIVSETVEVRRSPQIVACPDLKMTDYRTDLLEHFWTCLESTQHLQISDEQTKWAMQCVQSEQNVCSMLSRFNEYVIEQLEYGNPIDGLYSAEDALRLKTVDCGGFGTLFIALCQSVGIPARMAVGFWAGYGSQSASKDMHAWAEALLPNGELAPFDPSTESLRRQGRSRKSGRAFFVGSDRICFSVGCDIPLRIDGQEHIVDILQHPIIIPPNVAKDLHIQTTCETTRL